MRMTATSNKRNSSASSLPTYDGSQATSQNHRKSAKSFGARPASGSVDCSSTFAAQGWSGQSGGFELDEPACGLKHVATSKLDRQIVAKQSQGGCSSTAGRKTTSVQQMARQQTGSTGEQTASRDIDELLEEASSELATAISNETQCEDHRKQNHCEIEKRRRDKMNHYIMELASVIPSFSNNQAKFDKLTVLRMAVQHVKSLRSSLCSFSSFHLRPSFLSSGNLLKNLILQMASQEAQDNLFMVVTCDSGKVLFVSQSSKDILNQDQTELVGQCLFDILHKDDVSKVKEQISHYNLEPKEMLIDSRTLQPIKHNSRQSFSQLQNQSNSTPQPGARRSFFFRVKSGRNTQPPTASSSASAQSPVLSLSSQANRKLPQSDIYNIEQSDIVATVIGGNDDTVRSQLRHSDSGFKAVGASEAQQRPSRNLPPPSFNAPSKAPPLTIDLGDFNISSISVGSGREDSNRINECDKTTSNDSINRSKAESVNKNYANKPTENSSSTVNPGINTAGSKRNSNIGGGRHCCNLNSRSSTSITSSCSSSSGITSDSQANEQSSSNESSPANKTDFEMGRNGRITNESNNARNSSSITNEFSSKKHWRYIVMHCTGYLKSITLRSDEFEDDEYNGYNSENNSSDDEGSSRTVNCLVAVCRRSPVIRDLKPDRPLTFTCRYSMEGKFVFVDQRTTIALGYTPQQLLGTSHYTYCHKDSVNTFKECHRQSILKSEPVSSDIYQFKRANGQHLWLQTSLKSFRNPWTKFIDYIVANHTTAEGNDPHYNEGCVPTKFNQDMTGEASQSSSPASSSSLSYPSVDSKKSSSPSSSSTGSSYSMESFASGGSIQALLNQIDRVKSGGIKHSLNLHKRRGDSHVVRSSGGSAGKSYEDSGNYSDPQSCSSLSSQNSALSSEYLTTNIRGINSFGENNHVPAVHSNSTNLNNSYYGQRMNSSRPAQSICVTSTNYLQQQQQQQASCHPLPIGTNTPGFDAATNAGHHIRSTGVKVCTRTPGKVTRLFNGSSKQHQRHYATHYHYRNQGKSGSSISSDTGNESAAWSSSIGSLYSNSSSNHHQDRLLIAGTPISQVSESGVKSNEQSIGKTHHQQQQEQPTYVMRPLETATMNMDSLSECQMQGQIDNMGNQIDFSSEMMTTNSYISQEVNSSYNNEVGLNQMHQMNSEQNISMTMQQQQGLPLPPPSPQTISHQQQQQHQAQSHGQQQEVDPNQMNSLMMWNTADSSQYQMNMMNNAEAGQICSSGDVTLMNMDVGNSNNQLIAHETVQCQQCTNHKCSNQQMISSNTDLNSIDLTSLAADGDLDEDQLLEYLAGCDPEAQLYHIQNSAFPQYNIYR